MSVLEQAESVPHTQSASVFAKILRGKKALVTGGSRGIGRATVLALAEAGADVAINFQSNAAAADLTRDLACELGVFARTYQGNVALDDEAHAMWDKIHADFGRIDVLVNNAGITRDKSFLKMTKAMWDEVLGVNLCGPYNLTQLALPAMIEAGWGRIVNMASIVGQMGNFGQANYAVTKAGLIGFTKTLAREVARKGVTVNAVAPGFIETDMLKDMPPAAVEAVKANTPVGRMGKAEEVAAAVVFLASPQSAYVTGQVLAVNGGMYM